MHPAHIRQVATLATLLASWVSLPLSATELARAEEIVGARCFLCHGMEGEALSPIFPRLAGQHSEYVVKQLEDFKTGKRAGAAMKLQATELTADEMKSLGKYFESKRAHAAPVEDSELVAVGRYIYNRGNQFSGIPSCASCHGPKGYGTPMLPRLAGQHPSYIEDQLKQFSKRERSNDNAVMHTVASKLSLLEIHAVAHYVASLE